MTADPALRHGGPDAGWYRPDGHGWQRISDGEVGDHEDAAHFMSDPNGRHESQFIWSSAGSAVSAVTVKRTITKRCGTCGSMVDTRSWTQCCGAPS